MFVKNYCLYIESIVDKFIFILNNCFINRVTYVICVTL